MIWKYSVNPPAIIPRRRIVATAIIYGLSLAVRFTSATGEEVEIPPQSVQTTIPAMSIIARNRAELPYAGWSPNDARPIFFRRGWSLPASSMPSCPSP